MQARFQPSKLAARLLAIAWVSSRAASWLSSTIKSVAVSLLLMFQPPKATYCSWLLYRRACIEALEALCYLKLSSVSHALPRSLSFTILWRRGKLLLPNAIPG